MAFFSKNKRWFIWATLVVAYLLSVFLRLNLSVIREELSQSFGLDAVAFGSLSAVYLYAYCLGQIPTGFFADTVGPRFTAAFGLLICAFGCYYFSQAGSSSDLFWGRFFIGLGGAVAYVCLMKVQSEWFLPYEFSTLAGACLFFGSLGSLFAYAPMVFFANFFGISESFLYFAVFSLFVGVACLLLIRAKKQETPAPRNKALDRKAFFKGFLSVVGNIRNVPLIVYYCSISSVYFAFASSWGVSFLEEAYNFSKAEASFHLSCFIIGYMVGCIGLGRVSDILRKRKIILVGAALVQSLLWGSIIFVPDSFFLQNYFLPIFFLLGASTGAIPVAITLVKESNPIEYTGFSVALINTCSALAAGLATKYFGVFLDMNKAKPVLAQYQYSFLFFLYLTLLMLLASLLSKDAQVSS